jgi:hypothetical protein
MTVSFSLVVLLGVAVWLMHRYAGLKFLHAAICFLFGFFLAASGAAPLVRRAVVGLIAVLSGRH